jgi:hypothetical protein
MSLQTEGLDVVAQQLAIHLVVGSLDRPVANMLEDPGSSAKWRYYSPECSQSVENLEF